MAQYKSISWQHKEEVTSTKLEQMAQNTEWLKSNLILGDAHRVMNGEYYPNPLEPGVSKITRLDSVIKPFNSGGPTAWMDLDITIPSGYSNLPIVLHSIGGPADEYLVSHLWAYRSATRLTFRIHSTKWESKILNGTLHVLLVGY